MPIFEYICQECGCAFEALVRSGEQVTCTRCDSHRLEKQMSAFAVGAGRMSEPAPGPCGTCGAPQPGMCQMKN
ncbi:MAG: FmdB family zinc ribbon protein [Myxococcales bacterium]|nr:zinc ribbon domain-containing protein [Myxococcota bacterium]MDW8280064.1 FmdB family zinc ribbon protein [Myxococcales bacterium]